MDVSVSWPLVREERVGAILRCPHPDAGWMEVNGSSEFVKNLETITKGSKSRW